MVHRGLNIARKKDWLVVVGLSSALAASVKRDIIELVIGEEVVV